jgi:phosphoglycerol transferase MdoB-like AlkP superfamily enzyme
MNAEAVHALPVKTGSNGDYSPLSADVLFLLGNTFVLLVLLTLLRAALLYTNLELAQVVPLSDLSRAFVIGLRFDLIVVCLQIAPLVLALLLPVCLGRRRVAALWLSLTGAFVLFAGVVELEFYREFHARLNSIAFHYLREDVSTVSSMIWNGFPVVRYLLLWAVLLCVYVFLLRWLNMHTRKRPVSGYQAGWRLPLVLLMVFFTFWGARGTLRSGPPLRWGDAFHSTHLFANHLALNGTYTFVKAVTSTSGKPDRTWSDAMPLVTALDQVRNLLLVPQDELIEPAHYTLLRRHTPVNRLPAAPKNVVLIMMESFSGAFTGALGNDHGVTPEFDKLANAGLLFDRFFSNGTHTHQGMFATIACFPNLPGYEYLMQQPEGQNHFSGLPMLLDQHRFNNVYVYNGDFAWDNQRGFFRNQGMSTFIGRDDFVDPVFIDPTWGVTDQDMFNRALAELNRMPADKPFFAVLQTLSNHAPFALPAELPVDEVSGYGDLDLHLTAQRYSDWALGQFMQRAAESSWYGDTLFVILGDHGFPVPRQLSEIDLLRFRVPLLILGAGIRDTYGAVDHTVATQTDVVPTIAGLLGEPFVHQCWGRNLLSLPEEDEGVGMIKPSGSEQTVALIRGDQLLVKVPQGPALLGRFTLSPEASYRSEDDPIRNSQLLRELTAFIQTAIVSLRENRTGVPAE